MIKKVARDQGLQARVARQDVWESAALESGDFPSYQRAIMHDWLGTLTLLASVLIPLFFVLDTFMMPADLLPRFAIYRGISTLITIAQRLIVRRTRPGRWSYLHGYLLSLHVGGVIA